MILVNPSEFMDKERWLVETTDCIYRDADIRDVSLLAIKFPMISMEASTITNCSFQGEGVMFDRILGCDFFNCSFDNINLNRSTIIAVCFYKCKFINIKAYDLDISYAIEFEGCYFENVKIPDFFIEAHFKNCEFDDVVLSEISIGKEKSSFSTVYNEKGGITRYCK